MTEINPYKTEKIPGVKLHNTCDSIGRTELTYSLIVGWLSSITGPIFLTLCWLYHDPTPLLETLGAFLLLSLVRYITPALLCTGLGIILGAVLRKAGVPIIQSRKLSFMLLAGFLLSFFMANFLLLITDQLNDDIFPRPITIPIFSATCSLGVLIATLISQFRSPSAAKHKIIGH
ncbi:MAG: hypothetical protein ACR2OA_21815 [Rubripirellula sp.]